MPSANLLQTIQDSFIGRDTPYPMADGTSGPRHYLDSAASTLMLRPAYQVAHEFLEQYASTHSELHHSARGATQAYHWAHERVLNFVGADPDSYCAYFAGSGATAGFNRIATELAVQRPERDIVLVSQMEHHSNDLPHRHHAGEVIHLPLLGDAESYGGLDIEAVAQIVAQYGERINYLTVTGASNVTGVLTPIHQLAQMMHGVGAYLLVDAAQMIAHAPVAMQSTELEDADIDLLVFAGHKIYAPGSPGVVIAKKSLLSSCSPAELGGGMVDDVYFHAYMPTATLPDREEAGTPNFVGAITLAAALEVLMKIGMDTIRAKEIPLIKQAWEGLAAIEGVHLYGPAPDSMPRTGTIAFNIEGLDHGLTAAALNDFHNVQLRNGCFCAHPYVREMLKQQLWAMNIDPNAPNAEAEVERKRGMARASFGLYTRESDVRALIAGVTDLVARKAEILALYETVGPAGYRHKHYTPDAEAIFDPARVLERVLAE